MRKSFDQEQKRAFRFVAKALTTQRTISILCIAQECGRENDPRWMTRIQNLLPVFVEQLNANGVRVVAVNHHCVRYDAETPLVDMVEATKCVQLRSGGAPPAGIRRVLPDDMVLEAHIRSLVDLGCASVTGAIGTAREAEAVGLVRLSAARELAEVSQERIQTARDIALEPTQPMLPE